MKYPKKLEQGATIGLVCPSSRISEERERECRAVLESLGYRVKLAENLTARYSGYMAGDGDVRGQWINAMFQDPEVDAVFCIRGGDGGSRAMDYVDFDLIRKNPKIFVGYSDVTSLHNAISKKCGLVTFHGPMVSSNMVSNFDEETKESFFKTLNAEAAYVFQNPKGHEIEVLKEGTACGELTGGNLSLLSASIGTFYEVDTAGKILFIEETCEPMCRIEKLTYHLRNSGKLKACAGILLGQFTDCINEDDPSYTELELFRDALKGLDIPVMYNIQSGHGHPMMTLPLGAVCTIDTQSKKIGFDTPQR